MAGSDNKIRQPGDVQIISANITRTDDGQSLNLLPYIIEINIYEDIFSSSLYGNISIRDAVNIIGTLPIVGDETLSLSIETPGLSKQHYDPMNRIQKTFAVYAVKNRILDEHKEQVYVIHFCSIEAMIDNITKVCKKFEGTTDEIAAEIWEEYLSVPRFFNGEGNSREEVKSSFTIADAPHDSKISFVPPMWSPMECLNWLAKRSIGKNYKTPTFLVFETTKQFYMTSKEALVNAQLENRTYFSDYVVTQPIQPRNSVDSVSLDYSLVENFEFLTNLDLLQSQNLGHFASSLYTLNLVEKQDALYYYDHSFGFKDSKHMENPAKAEDQNFNMLFPFNVARSADSKPILATINPGVLDSTEDSVDLHPDTFISQRISNLMDISTLRMKIVVPGRTDAEVGRLIRFHFPSVGNRNTDSGNPETIWDPLVSGTYMITAIHHHITKIRHTMTLEIAKDSYATPILDGISIQGPQSGSQQQSPSSGPTTETSDENQPGSSGPVNTQGWTHPMGGQGVSGSRYGWRTSPITGKRQFHQGIDYPAAAGTPIYAAKGGIVTRAEMSSSYGNVVYIDHGDGIETRYGHMLRTPSVSKGQRVTAGTRLGVVGSTGNSTGNHLHFEVRKNGKAQNPVNYVGR